MVRLYMRSNKSPKSDSLQSSILTIIQHVVEITDKLALAQLTKVITPVLDRELSLQKNLQQCTRCVTLIVHSKSSFGNLDSQMWHLFWLIYKAALHAARYDKQEIVCWSV